ncbi:hypothetical protein J5N97_006087 [Dioscorea zingiberensis]|uniref:Angiotensin-converting enzyme 2 n=1 Tax=Dioscorea zingiberensis TaxID=325984 RepID=A0A9D5D9P3_9LILI|nr:hypothetical protein J5N97_006087 [Dioscorea zingiberensis]
MIPTSSALESGHLMDFIMRTKERGYSAPQLVGHGARWSTATPSASHPISAKPTSGSERENERSDIMGESSASYIRMVQHLIEKCLLFNMNKEECMEALSKHANIKPVITSTVWKELEKENRQFFETYTREREERLSEMETMQRIQKMLEDSAGRDPDNEG